MSHHFTAVLWNIQQGRQHMNTSSKTLSHSKLNLAQKEEKIQGHPLRRQRSRQRLEWVTRNFTSIRLHLVPAYGFNMTPRQVPEQPCIRIPLGLSPYLCPSSLQLKRPYRHSMDTWKQDLHAGNLLTQVGHVLANCFNT